MRVIFSTVLTVSMVFLVASKPAHSPALQSGRIPGGLMYFLTGRDKQIRPKVFIISHFDPEAQIWYEGGLAPGSFGNLLALNITIPGFSPRYPHAHCLADRSICQVTTGEAEINAASTITALVTSKYFDLQKTYFLIGGIAGVNPKYGTLGDVALPKYAVQVALQYEFDAREIPNNLSTGYIPFGVFQPNHYPESIYGTEVFELNEALRDVAVQIAKTAKLHDSSNAQAYRARYTNSGDETLNEIYQMANRAPGVITCDVATSDVWYSGRLLGEAFENTTKLWTNGSATYCMTAEEDNATLEALLRASIRNTVDFSRIILMRAGSNFDRQFPGSTAIQNLFYVDSGGFIPSIENLFLAGSPVINAILSNWTTRFEKGIKPSNYIGDILGTLGGVPDFGPKKTEFDVKGYKGLYAMADGSVNKRGERDSWRDRYQNVNGGLGRLPAA